MLTIRPATQLDLPGIDRIFNDAMCTSDWIPVAARGHVDFSTASEGEQVFVSVDSSDLVNGFISVWQPESFIHHLYVDPNQKRCGIGTALLQSLDAWLEKPWTLKCVQRNSAALSFYHSRGWRTVERGQGDHGTYLLLEFGDDG